MIYKLWTIDNCAYLKKIFTKPWHHMVPATVKGLRGQFNVINIFCLFAVLFVEQYRTTQTSTQSISELYICWTMNTYQHNTSLVAIVYSTLPYTKLCTYNKPVVLLTCLFRVIYILLQVIGNSCT